MIQVNILSPKSPISAFASIDLPVKRAALLLFATFLLGFLPHLLFSVPSAGEPTQGYLHGGLLIDFIGQRGPTSRLRLLFVDVVILILQLTMLAITATTTPKTPETGTTTVARVVASAELDRAERGETEEEEMTVQEGSEETGLTATGFEHVVVSVGIVETIKSLWDDTTPLVRRFR